MIGVKFMIFKIKNFGKIAEADIKLDGITVICGDNDTGKSTVGKAVFSFFNGLNDYKSKIDAQKYSKLRSAVRNYIYHSADLAIKSFDPDNAMEYISEHYERFSLDEVKDYLESFYSVKLTKDQLESLVNSLNASEIDILNEYVSRYIFNVMNGQIKNAYSSNSSHCSISGEIQNFTNTIKIYKQFCKCELDEPIEHSAYYINNPFVLDWLNNPDRMNVLKSMNPMDRSAVYAIMRAQADINADSMSNILESVQNKKELKAVRGIIKKAYSGETVIDHGRYYYSENGVSVDFRNISAGLKSFALIERMLETGVLKKKDVLILDEPEIHLHSEWQIYYAELIVMLQIQFDLTILLVTHSFQFLESLDFFMRTLGISNKGNYYIPVKTEKGFIMKSYGNNPDELKQNLSAGSVKLANLEFEYDMEHDEDET